MKIEIVTTKKKLSKSIVNQMKSAHTVALKCGTSLGYLIGIRKNAPCAILIKYDHGYFIMPDNYTKGETSVYRKIGKWSQTKKFDTPEECNVWWDAYQKRIKEASTQIYI